MADIYSGEISTASFGMKVERRDQAGENIEDSGEKGDLVITKPFFSMPVTFWGPGGEEKYRKEYFEQFPVVMPRRFHTPGFRPRGGMRFSGAVMAC